MSEEKRLLFCPLEHKGCAYESCAWWIPEESCCQEVLRSRALSVLVTVLNDIAMSMRPKKKPKKE